jgi:hypothetical protein
MDLKMTDLHYYPLLGKINHNSAFIILQGFYSHCIYTRNHLSQTQTFMSISHLTWNQLNITILTNTQTMGFHLTKLTTGQFVETELLLSILLDKKHVPLWAIGSQCLQECIMTTLSTNDWNITKIFITSCLAVLAFPWDNSVTECFEASQQHFWLTQNHKCLSSI